MQSKQNQILASKVLVFLNLRELTTSSGFTMTIYSIFLTVDLKVEFSDKTQTAQLT